MKIFHLITHFDLGGAERVAANIAESSTPGMHYHVMEIMRGRSAYTPQFIAELRSHGIRCHRSLIPDISWHFVVERVAALLFPLRMLYVMLRWRPDVIHTHTETPDLSLYVFARLFPCLLRRVRIVRTIHNTRLWSGQDSVAAHVERFFNRHNANVAISCSVRDAYAKRFGVTQPIITNGVGEAAQKPFGGLDNTRINILFAGRLEPQKGVSVLCEVMKALNADNRFCFVVAGDGSLRHMVEHAIAHGGADGGALRNARLVPPIFALPSHMASFDYLFMPSEFEGLSMLSMEASFNALPVIANDAPGLRDTLPPDWPLLAHGNSLADYLHIFRDILPAADRARMVAMARQYALPRFSVRRMQMCYEALYSGRNVAK